MQAKPPGQGCAVSHDTHVPEGAHTKSPQSEVLGKHGRQPSSGEQIWPFASQSAAVQTVFSSTQVFCGPQILGAVQSLFVTHSTHNPVAV
jgi:hypothetical protein